MQAAFDPEIVDSLLSTAQLSQADVARALEVSREAVSNWMSSDSVPRPRHRTMLAALLGVSVSALAGAAAVREPVVAFRVKGNRKVKDEKSAWIKRDMVWLEALEKRMSASGWMESLPEHRGGATAEHALAAAARFRKELGLDRNDDLIVGHRLFLWLSERGVVLVPVLWGAKEHPLNAMYVRLPDSDIHWLYVSLDASVVDVRFWLLHEVAHMIRRRPHDADEAEEHFADTFAAEVLFPREQAADFMHIGALKDVHAQADSIRRLALARGISPVTVYRQLNRVFDSVHEARLTLDAIIYPQAIVLAKNAPRWVDGLFGGQTPSGLHFITTCTDRLGTQVFNLAAQEVVENNRGHGFVEKVFQCSAADAMSLHEALSHFRG
ncbi:MAG: hypothetical protein WBQ23_00370 [Bacteroidota bacterium]